MLSDCELLRRYVENGSEEAFTELVRRHINVVYRAALRRVGRNAHSADDVTQRVFTDLARKAGSLLDRSNLAGWLYTSTRFAAAEVVRTEQRRRAREQQAQAMHDLETNSALPADHLDPFLDEVMDLLPTQDREAVLLHFFEGHAFAEVGALLSLSPDAARMRVNRALERIRTAFARRGVSSSGAALAALLTAQSTFAAPAALALSVSSHALAQSVGFSAGVSLFSRLLHAVKWSSTLFWSGSAVIVAIVGLALVLHRSDPEPTIVASDVHADSTAKPAPQSFAATATPGSSVLASPSSSPEAALSSKLPANATPKVPHRPSPFTKMSEEEKNLLSRLWMLEENAGEPPGLRAALRVGVKAPNFAGCAPLLEKGLARQSANGAGIFLTKLGLAFCESHRDEITARAAFMNENAPPNEPTTTNRARSIAPEIH